MRKFHENFRQGSGSEKPRAGSGSGSEMNLQVGSGSKINSLGSATLLETGKVKRELRYVIFCNRMLGKGRKDCKEKTRKAKKLKLKCKLEFSWRIIGAQKKGKGNRRKWDGGAAGRIRT